MSRLVAMVLLAVVPTVVLAGGLALSGVPARAQDTGGPQHGIAMHGEPLYGPDFTHFAYANPEAPTGGTLIRQPPPWQARAFDSLNPFIVQGRTAPGVRDYHFATLMARAWDEPFSLYGYVADTIETPADRSWVEFQLNPAAQFHDGTPVTVDDVIFSMETLREHGLPSFRRNYGFIETVERVGDLGVRFTLTDEAEYETPMVLALMPILSQAWYTENDVSRPSLEVPLGSGPYRIAGLEAGRQITYERVDDWWAADLPAFRGMYNFDVLRFDIYLDADVAFEAFKVGEYTWRREQNADNWAAQYTFPAVTDGRVTLQEIPHSRPSGMRAFVFNTRRPAFEDRRVRQALLAAFDFEWVNSILLRDQYRRIDSMFANSDLAAENLPSPGELALLEPFRDQLPPELFTEPPALPVSDGSGRNRNNLRTATALLREAGYTVEEGVLVDAAGAPFTFEIMLNNAGDERLGLAYTDMLRRLGIVATVRVVDSAQYRERLATYDYDMILNNWLVTLSPGTEQHFYWSSQSADTEGTRNYAGVRNPAVDALAIAIGNARSREDLRAAVRAFDRVLLWGAYGVPLYYSDVDRIAFWGELRWVEDYVPIYGTVLEAWWMAP